MAHFKIILAGVLLPFGIQTTVGNKLVYERSDEGLTLETSAFLPFTVTVANLCFQPSC